MSAKLHETLTMMRRWLEPGGVNGIEASGTKAPVAGTLTLAGRS